MNWLWLRTFKVRAKWIGLCSDWSVPANNGALVVMSTPDLIEIEFETESNRHLVQASQSCLTLQPRRATFSCRTCLRHTCVEKSHFWIIENASLWSKKNIALQKLHFQSARAVNERQSPIVGPGEDFHCHHVRDNHHGRHGLHCHLGHNDDYGHHGRHGHQDKQVRDDRQNRQDS